LQAKILSSIFSLKSTGVQGKINYERRAIKQPVEELGGSLTTCGIKILKITEAPLT
jgi:hypothetical protein